MILEHWAGRETAESPARPIPSERHLFAVLAAHLPASAVVVVTGEADANEEDRLTTQMLNSALESRLRQAVSSSAQGNRALTVVALDEFELSRRS